MPYNLVDRQQYFGGTLPHLHFSILKMEAAGSSETMPLVCEFTSVTIGEDGKRNIFQKLL
jgi:hypothetical protein